MIIVILCLSGTLLPPSGASQIHAHAHRFLGRGHKLGHFRGYEEGCKAPMIKLSRLWSHSNQGYINVRRAYCIGIRCSCGSPCCHCTHRCYKGDTWISDFCAWSGWKLCWTCLCHSSDIYWWAACCQVRDFLLLEIKYLWRILIANFSDAKKINFNRSLFRNGWAYSDGDLAMLRIGGRCYNDVSFM